MIRTLLEHLLSRRRFWRSLPVGGASVPMLVSPSGGLKFLFKAMSAVDPQLISLVEDYVKPGDVVWDIGANLGLFSFAAAHLAGVNGHIYAFEPDVWLVDGLRQSSRRQSTASAPVTVIPAAVADHVALRTFSIAARSRASSHLAEYGASQVGGVIESQTVPAFTIDWFASRLPHPDLVKIDVEGAEREVLAGAVELFDKCRPLVICEVGVTERDWVTGFFHARNYDLYTGLVPKAERKPIEKASWSTIAIPR